MNEGGRAFLGARDFLFRHRDDYAAACAGFRWPELDRVQLGARLVRRARARQPPPGPPDRRDEGGDDADQLRRDGRALLARRQLPARARRPPRRPRAGDAPQRRPPLGDHAGGDQARRGRHPRLHAAHGRRPPGPRRARRVRHVVTDAPSAEKLAAVPGDYTRLLVGGAMEGCGPTRRRYAAPPISRPTARPAPTIRSSSTSPRGPPRSPSWCCTPTRATRWGTSRRCTGSACGRGTCTTTSARRAGPSTPGAASSRRGTRAPPSSSTSSRASTAGRPSRCWPATGSPRSARRPRCGGC